MATGHFSPGQGWSSASGYRFFHDDIGQPWDVGDPLVRDADFPRFMDTWWIGPPSVELQRRLEQDDMDIDYPNHSVSAADVPSWERGRNLHNQFIPDNINPSQEALVEADFLIGAGRGYVTFPSVLVSAHYVVSYIFLDTLRELEHQPIIANIKRSPNPRGEHQGQLMLQPIGFQMLYMKFKLDSLHETTVFINFLVLPGRSRDAGVFAIIGKPDIDRIHRASLTPEPRLELLN